jgi:DNA polymerase III subunit gamma/tau
LPEQALYLKWRPAAFDEFVGQEHIVRTLRNSLKTGRIRHAYLFSGPRGTGKTTTARLLAKAVNCQDPDPEKRPCNVCAACIAVNEGRYLDLIEIDAATHTGVDDVRELRDRIAFSPGEGKYKIYIIDEVHRFSGSAFDALLKTLEEPPEHAIFVLATTEIDKVPATIKSRSLQFEFRRFSMHEVADRLELIAKNEGLDIERGALELIARQGTGSMRDSISLLDQVVSDPDEKITVEVAQRILGTASVNAVRKVVEALVSGDVAEGLHEINAAVDTGSDPRQLGQQIVEHLRSVLLAQTASADLVAASQEERALYADQAANLPRATLLRAIRSFNDAVSNYRGGWQPQLALELALVESVRGSDEAETQRDAPLQQPSYASSPDIAAMVRQMVTEHMSRFSGDVVREVSAPPVVETPANPSLPPVIAIEAVREKWDEMLKNLYGLNRNAPALVQHFRPVRVDGNVLTISTPEASHIDPLQTGEHAANRVRVIETALQNVHGVVLKLKVILSDNQDASGGAASKTIDDPLIRFGIEELGGEIRDDH